MSENHPPTRKLGRWQFSLRSMLYVTAATAALLMVHLNDQDVPVVVYPAVFLAGAAWTAILLVLAGTRSPLRHGMLGGVVGVVGFQFVIWGTELSRLIGDDEILFMGLFAAGSLAVVNLFTLVLIPKQHDASETTNETERADALARRRTAIHSLSVLGVILFITLWPIPSHSEAEVIFYLYLFLLASAFVPWFIAWRRRRLAGRVLPITWADRCAQHLSTGAVLLAIVSGLTVAGYIAWYAHGWGGVSAFVIGSCIHIFAGAMLVVSLVIQWYRDHWQLRSLVMVLVYILLITPAFLTLVP